MTIVNKKNTTCQMIDFGVPKVNKAEDNEKKKEEKYQDLKRELQNIWSCKSSCYS